MKTKKSLNKLSLTKSTVANLNNLAMDKARAGADVVGDVIAILLTEKCSEQNLCETVFAHYCVTKTSLSCFHFCDTTKQCGGGIGVPVDDADIRLIG